MCGTSLVALHGQARVNGGVRDDTPQGGQGGGAFVSAVPCTPGRLKSAVHTA